MHFIAVVIADLRRRRKNEEGNQLSAVSSQPEHFRNTMQARSLSLRLTRLKDFEGFDVSFALIDGDEFEGVFLVR